MKGVSIGLIGRVSDKNKLVVNGISGRVAINTNIKRLKENWQKPFNKLMH